MGSEPSIEGLGQVQYNSPSQVPSWRGSSLWGKTSSGGGVTDTHFDMLVLKENWNIQAIIFCPSYKYCTVVIDRNLQFLLRSG